MNNSINRTVKRNQSERDRARREISRMTLFEKPVDPEKERRSILMSRWPKKEKPKNG